MFIESIGTSHLTLGWESDSGREETFDIEVVPFTTTQLGANFYPPEELQAISAKGLAADDLKEGDSFVYNITGLPSGISFNITVVGKDADGTQVIRLSATSYTREFASLQNIFEWLPMKKLD